ncbi:MAG TPA: tetratricopeptide repeat protein, partial [Bacteroidia bacterium]|nr:tetratricopeptide repeat protein [Bacteroidia bacterium]
MKKIIITSLAISIFISSCTNGLYKKGVKNYDKLAYHKAIENFEKYLTKKDEPIDAKVKLANAYRLVNDYPNAEKWYSRIVNSADIDPSNYFYYGKILMNAGKYDEAKIWLTKYLEKVP